MEIINTIVHTYYNNVNHMKMPHLRNVKYITPFKTFSTITSFDDQNGRNGFVINITIKSNNNVEKSSITIYNWLNDNLKHVIYYGPTVIYDAKFVEYKDYQAFYEEIESILYGETVYKATKEGVIYEIALEKN